MGNPVHPSPKTKTYAEKQHLAFGVNRTSVKHCRPKNDWTISSLVLPVPTPGTHKLATVK
jgi:hypothetical protein